MFLIFAYLCKTRELGFQNLKKSLINIYSGLSVVLFFDVASNLKMVVPSWSIELLLLIK